MANIHFLPLLLPNLLSQRNETMAFKSTSVRIVGFFTLVIQQQKLET